MDMNIVSTRRKIIRNWPVTYMIRQVRKVVMTLEAEHGEEKVWIRDETGHISQKGAPV